MVEFSILFESESKRLGVELVLSKERNGDNASSGDTGSFVDTNKENSEQRDKFVREEVTQTKGWAFLIFVPLLVTVAFFYQISGVSFWIFPLPQPWFSAVVSLGVSILGGVAGAATFRLMIAQGAVVTIYDSPKECEE